MGQHSQPPRRAAKEKQNTFFGGAAILAGGILVTKLIGLFYKIPLVNIIGAQGNTDFTNAYNIYAVLLTVSTAGLPVAVSKLVSEANALGRRNQVKRTFRLAMTLFLMLGIVSFLVMYFRSEWLAGMMNDTKAAAGIRALAPAVVCVGCLAALRGYTQGHLNMTPTSASQIIEAFCKLVVGLALAYWLIKAGQPPEIAAAGAITGVTVGTVVALAYMLISFLLTQYRAAYRSDDIPDGAGSILRDILRIAVPITLSASMVGIVTVIDSSLVQGRLQQVLLENPDSWALYAGSVDFAPLQQAISAWTALLPEGTKATMAALSAQVDQAMLLSPAAAPAAVETAALALRDTLESVSRTLYGNYGGALNIYNLPTSLMAAITASVIPAVSGVLAKRDRRGAAKISASALRITALLAIPMGVGLLVLGTPIMEMLYPTLNTQLAGPLLSALGAATPFVCLMLVCNSILQAHGFVNLPVIVMLVGGGVKIFANYNVVVLPTVGIYGAPVGNILCFGLCLLLDLILISRAIPNRPKFAAIFLKPAAASALMGGAAWAIYGLLSQLLAKEGTGAAGEAVKQLSRTGNAAATLAAIAVAMAVYVVVVVALRGISKDDLSLMPGGQKLARLLRM